MGSTKTAVTPGCCAQSARNFCSKQSDLATFQMVGNLELIRSPALSTLQLDLNHLVGYSTAGSTEGRTGKS